MECVWVYVRRTDVIGTEFKLPRIKQVNIYRFLELNFMLNIFLYGLAFVICVTMDRWHHSQSDAVRWKSECAMVTALEQFWREEGLSLFGFVWVKYFFPYNVTFTDRAVSY